MLYNNDILVKEISIDAAQSTNLYFYLVAVFCYYVSSCIDYIHIVIIMCFNYYSQYSLTTLPTQVASVLQCLSQGGRTILLTLDRPTQHTMHYMNDIMLLGSGLCVYSGPVCEVASHFGNIGEYCVLLFVYVCVFCFVCCVLCFVFCVSCFVFHVLCFVFCVLCFVFCVCVFVVKSFCCLVYGPSWLWYTDLPLTVTSFLNVTPHPATYRLRATPQAERPWLRARDRIGPGQDEPGGREKGKHTHSGRPGRSEQVCGLKNSVYEYIWLNMLFVIHAHSPLGLSYVFSYNVDVV
jgi:hypothetical protein